MPQVFAISKGQFTPPVGEECVFSKTHGLEKQHVYNLFGSNYKEIQRGSPQLSQFYILDFLKSPQAKQQNLPYGFPISGVVKQQLTFYKPMKFPITLCQHSY